MTHLTNNALILVQESVYPAELIAEQLDDLLNVLNEAVSHNREFDFLYASALQGIIRLTGAMLPTPQQWQMMAKDDKRTLEDVQRELARIDAEVRERSVDLTRAAEEGRDRNDNDPIPPNAIELFRFALHHPSLWSRLEDMVEDFDPNDTTESSDSGEEMK